MTQEHSNKRGLETKDSSEQALKKQKTHPNYHINAQENKSDRMGYPAVWSLGRDALCSSLPYFKSYQGGSYTHSGFVHGCLIDRESGLRDIFDNDVVITNIGGGKVAGADGKMIQQADQKKGSVIQSFFRTMAAKRPVAIIAGQGNKLSPSTLPHAYNVLGWFHLTSVWCEVAAGFQTWRYRAERIDINTLSWWTPSNSVMPVSAYSLFQVTEASCRECCESSKVIFQHGWDCLNPECSSYFFVGQSLPEEQCVYTQEFIQERTPFQGPTPQLIAPLFEPYDETDDISAEGKYQKGFVCPNCGCCSRRKEWTRWSCENIGCTFSIETPVRSLTLAEAISGKILKTKKPHEDVAVHLNIRIGGYKVDLYYLPGLSKEKIGIVAHFKANEEINAQPGGPNDIFKQLQLLDLGLKRQPVYSTGTILEVLTNHFGANWGAPYKFVAQQDSKPFIGAPPIIHTIVDRLTWAGRAAVHEFDNCEKFFDFNELLTLAYLRGQKISYHDDGETSLGPTVASISLGATAKMSWRPKKDTKTLTTPGTSSNKAGTKPPFLEILLKHGDLMVMHGAEIQTNYAHAVEHNGSLRFGLTSRYIRPEMMETLAERDAAIASGMLPSGDGRIPYDGDLSIVYSHREDLN